MTDSYLRSLVLHAFVLFLILLGAASSHAPEQAPEEVKVQVRKMEVARPEKPLMKAGAASEPSPPQPPKPARIDPVPNAIPETPVDPPTPPAVAAASATTKSKREASKPQFLISSPDYPTYQPEQDSGPGDDPVSLKGQDALQDRPAVPYYHPAVTLEGANGRDWILVRFEVETNGTFEVEILEGTGNIHQDARALHVLRRWKWLPMQIDGQTYASVEVVRLYRRDL